MSNITERKDTQYQEGDIIEFSQAAVNIYEGALVAINSSGYATNASDASGDVVVGVADETIDNSAGSAGDKKIRVRVNGVHEFKAGFSAAQTNVGDLAYASDNQTVDLAGNLTNDVLVGRIVKIVSSSKVRVHLERRV